MKPLEIGNPFLIQLNLIKKCTLKCSYCYLKKVNDLHLSLKGVENFLLKFSEWTSKYKFFLHLNLTGGDLWMHSEIEKICNFVYSQKFISKISLLINDLNYKKAKEIILGLKDKIDVVQVNLALMSERKEDLAFLAENDIKSVVKLMLSKSVDISNQIKIANSLKEAHPGLLISIDRFCPLNRSDYKNVLSLDSFLRVIRKIKLIFGSSFITDDPVIKTISYLEAKSNKRARNLDLVGLNCISGCIVPNGGFAVYPDGDIKLCSRMSGFNTGFNVDNFDLLEYLKKFYYIQEIRKNNCGKCKLFNLCLGGCIATSYAKNNLINKDAHCLENLSHERKNTLR